MRQQFFGALLSCAAEISACWHQCSSKVFGWNDGLPQEGGVWHLCLLKLLLFLSRKKNTICFLPYRRAGIIFLEAEFDFPDNISISYLSLLAFAWALLSLSCRFLHVFARFSEKFPHHHPLYYLHTYSVIQVSATKVYKAWMSDFNEFSAAKYKE